VKRTSTRKDEKSLGVRQENRLISVERREAEQEAEAEEEEEEEEDEQGEEKRRKVRCEGRLKKIGCVEMAKVVKISAEEGGPESDVGGCHTCLVRNASRSVCSTDLLVLVFD
jgi:hypothetical protein